MRCLHHANFSISLTGSYRWAAFAQATACQLPHFIKRGFKIFKAILDAEFYQLFSFKM